MAALLQGRHVYFAIHHNRSIINMLNVTLMKREVFRDDVFNFRPQCFMMISAYLLEITDLVPKPAAVCVCTQCLVLYK